MKVTLIDYTGAGTSDPERHAANVLVFTKRTRLEMDPSGFSDIEAMPATDILKELEYMAKTIPSSWEFVSYTFLVNNVTRAFTHQFVRSRTGSYAQQTMRVLDVQGWDALAGPTVQNDPDRLKIYQHAIGQIDEAYRTLINDGAKIEDARGILPTNILTNIVAKFDLRAMTDLARKRASSRVQGEYREVLSLMKQEVMRVHPWTSLFFGRNTDVVTRELEEFVESMHESKNIGDSTKTDMVKLIDELRK